MVNRSECAIRFDLTITNGCSYSMFLITNLIKKYHEQQTIKARSF